VTTAWSLSAGGSAPLAEDWIVVLELEAMTRKIMIVRHAEKPDGEIAGISMEGVQDPEELTSRGWQRSGALIGLFAPKPGPFSDDRLSTPQFIYASGVGSHSKSLRPQHTVESLAEQLGQQLNLTHLKGEEGALAADVLARSGHVLIAWEHEAIPAIVNRIVGNSTTCPQTWPDQRFDLVWVLDQTAPGDTWTFSQVPQELLPGDDSTTIPFS
jgi:hypothetical protein